MSEPKFLDFALVRRPPVADSEIIERAGVTIAPVPDGTILQLIGKPTLKDSPSVEGADLRPAGPGQWFAVFDEALSPSRIEAVRLALRESVSIIDQSHGRKRFRLQGPSVRRVLSKGTGVDLHADLFPIGAATSTLFGHVTVHLTRTGEDVFELMVLRGFAESLWHDLEQMAAPLG